LHGGGNASLVEHWDGSIWSIVPSPTGVYFNDVSCPTATSCIAVGGDLTPAVVAAVWDGTSMSMLSVPQPTVTYERGLEGVSCATTTLCFAVGYTFDTSAKKSLVEMWDGSSWSIVPSPNPAGGWGDLHGVACPSVSRCIAVGTDQANYRALVESWDGTAWTIANAPNPTGRWGDLHGVSCLNDTTCRTVGASDSLTTNGKQQTLVEGWDGTNWSIEQSANVQNDEDFVHSVSCVSATNCQAVGLHYSDPTDNTTSITGTLVLTSALPSPVVSISATPLAAAASPVTYAVSVATGANGTPTGSVTISDDHGDSCLIATLLSGSGSCALTQDAAASPYAVTAAYSGDSNYSPSSSTISIASSVAVGGTATAGSGGLTATAGGGTDGSDTLTTTQYVSDPVGAPTFNTAGKYFDVAVSPGSSFTTTTITNCNIGTGSDLQWWDPNLNAGGGGWTPVLGDPGPTYDAGPPACVTVTLDATTSPTLAQLTGTVFAAAGPTITGSLQITTPGLSAATLGTPYSTTLTAVNGTGTLKWKKTGKLPLGLKLNPKTGVISGTPKKQTGTFTFSIVVKDSSRRPKHQASQVFTIKVH
jgi:hypothetical protein